MSRGRRPDAINRITARLASVHGGLVQGWNHGKPGERFDVVLKLEGARAGDFDAAMVPGGGPLTDRHNTVFTHLDPGAVNAALAPARG